MNDLVTHVLKLVTGNPWFETRSRIYSLVCVFLAQESPVGQGLIHEVSISHTTHHTR